MARSTDLDAALGFDTTPIEDQPTSEATLFGRQWRILSGINQFAAVQIQSGNADAITQAMVDFVHPDERELFERTLRTTDAFRSGDVDEDVRRLVATFNALAGVAAAPRPTNASSGSSSSSPKRAAVKRSAAASSRKAATRTR